MSTPALDCARVLVDELVRCGVREAVLCPGSRSAPLAYALQEADAAGRLRLHVRVDERSAAFLALGLAKLTRQPAVVVTTSGTAVANLHPAVLEAHHAGVPLIVLSADRPPELRGTGANQTTAQPGLFGQAARWSADLGTPADVGSMPVWRSTVGRAYAAATGALDAPPGPVHVNVPFRDPLAPAAGELEQPLDEALAGRADDAPWVAVQPAAAHAATLDSATSTANSVGHQPHTVVLVGDLPDLRLIPEVYRVARQHGWPVVAEPYAADRGDEIPLRAGAALIGDAAFVAAHPPDRVVVVGRITLSRSAAALIRAAGQVDVVVAQASTWPDPGHRAQRIVPWADFLAWGDDEAVGCAGFALIWQEGGRAAARAVDACVQPATTEPALTGPVIADVVLREIDDSATLFVGSSNSVRDLDLVRRTPGGPFVVASRGLAGIDGCVATAVGIALASPTPTYALVGDLTLLHDANGLLIGPGEPRPDLTIVVTNDDGGGIFTTLEHGGPELAGRFERIFGTPTGADLAALAQTYGAHHRLVETRDELAAALHEPPHGITIVEARVDRGAHRAGRAALVAAVHAELTDLVDPQ